MPKEYQHKTIAGFFTAHRDRWIKGDFEKVRKGQTCFCLMGKVRELYDSHDQDRVTSRLKNAIEALFPTTFNRITKQEKEPAAIVVTFNDANHRRIQDIIDVAREAQV